MAIVLLVALPLVTAAGFLVDRQAGDIAATRQQSIALDFRVRLQAVAIGLHDLRTGVLLDRQIKLIDRLAVERALTHLYDFGSGRGRPLAVEKSLKRIQNAWVAIPERGDVLPQIDRTIAQTYDLGLRIDGRSLRTGIDEVSSDLVDAFAQQTPTIEERVDQQQALLLTQPRGASGAGVAIGRAILAAQTQRAYEAASADLGRAANVQPSVQRAERSLKGVGVALGTFDRVASRPSGFSRPALVRAGTALSLAIGNTSQDIVSQAQLALSAHLMAQRDSLRWLRIDAVGAAAFALLVGFLLWRSIRVRDRRDLLRARAEAQRLTTERENDRMRQALASTEARFEAVFDRASIGAAILDMSGALVRTNAALERMLPATTPGDVGAEHPDFGRLIAGDIDGYTTEREIPGTESVAWIEAVVSLVRDDAGAPSFAVAILKDVTERRAVDDLLRYEAKHDVLVQLPNRAFLFERMREMLATSGQVFGVMFVDLDGFKVVNDSLGHEIGDRVLVSAARRMASAVDTGDFVARFGGDEFVALLRARATREETIAAADRVVRALAVPFKIDSREIFVTISAGLALVDRPYDAVEDILRDADTAMYRAKMSGRSRCAVFDAEMRDSATRRLELASQLRRAVEREQIFLVFQPVVTLATERIASFEVLVRWEHPELGLVAPSEFIPLAEEIGLIVPLGRWVFEHACAQLARWRSESQSFANIYLAVNASVRELLQSDYCEFVERTVQRHGLRSGDLVLEVTETAVLQSDRYAEGMLQRLKRAGVGLAIDDFGTGYSSLRYLQHFPFDHLKIDAAFIKGPDGGLASEAIVSMLLALGRSFGVNVIAEGVETLEQAATLRSLGCTSVQGFLYGLPVAPSLVGELLQRRKARVAS